MSKTLTLSRIHGYLLFAILLTVAIDMSGVLTNLNHAIKVLTYSEENETSIREIDFSNGPVILDPEINSSLNLAFQPNGYVMRLNLMIDYEGSTPIFKTLTSQSDLSCLGSNESGKCLVQIVVDANEQSEFLLYTVSGTTTIREMRLQPYKGARTTTTTGTMIFAYFLFFALLGGILRKLDSSTSNFILSTISICVLLALSFELAILLSIFLISSYTLVIQLINTVDRRSQIFSLFLFFTISSFLIVKLLVPVSSHFFQNPGGVLLAVPLGFSYFIIKIVDLAIDAYRKRLRELSILSFLTYLLLPTTIPAGPIKTYKQFLSARISEFTIIDYSAGVARVLVGISKKLLADAMLLPHISSQIDQFAADPNKCTPESIMFMLCGNFLYVYLDFSAYCDMAIGSSRAMGYKVPENFKWPLFRTSITEYWQHWHITLSGWVRKNVFMNSMLMTRSLFLSTFSAMLVIGLWHKLSLGWLSWALHHTLLLRAENWVKRNLAFKVGLVDISTNIAWFLKKCLGIPQLLYVWFFVSAGHSFLVFTDYQLSINAYFQMLSGPFKILHSMFSP
jgi:alginate O-acetyltransferase complex protein AlgI